MQEQLEDPAREARNLQRCINDLVSVLSLSAIWRGSEPTQIVENLLDVLLRMLSLDFAYGRLNEAFGAMPLEILRIAEGCGHNLSPEELRNILGSFFSADAHTLPRIRSRLGNAETSIFPVPLGIQGEIGVLVVGSDRVIFPQKTENLLLSVAANQATIGLQEARFRSQQKRLAEELDQRVVQRTAELAAANEELHQARASLQRALDEVQGSEAKLRQVIDAIPTLAWCNLPDGPNEFLSKGWHEYTGLSPEESHGWGWQAAFHPDDLPPLMEKWGKMLASGESDEIEARLRRHDGAYRWFLIRCQALRDAAGKIIRWYGTSTDIEDRKRAEEAQRASERNLASIINTIPTTAWTTRGDGYCDFLNQGWLDYAGMAAEKAKGWGWAEAIHPDDREKLVEEWQSCLAAGIPIDAEARIRRFDNTYRWFLIRANPLTDDAGNILKWYGICTDIEDRKRGEEVLRDREQSLRLILDGIAGLVAIMSATGEVEAVNRQVVDYFGRSVAEMKGWSTSNAVHPDDLARVIAAWIRSVETGSPYDVDHRLRRVDGVYRWFHARGLPLRDREGRILRWYVLLTDMDDRKRAEEELRNAQSELARVMRVMTMGQLTASIAHEVNQPLSGIITNASTCLRMLDGNPPNLEGARETARRTIRDGHRASDVVTRLRTLYSKKVPAVEPMDLNEAAREVTALSATEIQRNGVTLRHEFAGDLPPALGDRIQLQQVISNLIRNAADAMGEVDDRPRELLIRTEREDGNRVRLSVRDSGVGIAPQAVDRIFEAFYTTKTDGMGIGLSVSRSIIEAHQGRLWATPNDGPGCTFSFAIPCTPEGIGDPARLVRRDSSVDAA